MHWREFNTKSFRWFSAIKNTYSHALMRPKHKIFSAIWSDQEYSWIYNGGTLTQNLFSDFQLSRKLFGMHWWDLNTKSFRRFAAIKNSYSHALMGPKHKIFSAICSDQEYSWRCIGGTLTQFFFGDFQLSRKLFDMHWWDLNTKSFRQYSAIKNTLWHALVGSEHKIFSVIFSYQEYLLTCIGRIWPRNLFVDLQLSRTLIHMHWWDLYTKSFQRFAAIKNTHGYAMVGP